MDGSSTCDLRVTGGGDQVAAHGGLFVLGRFADGLGLGEALSAVVAPGGERAPVHDRGKVLVHVLLMLAGGGEACSDIEHLRAQPVLFGDVASDSTLYRTLRGLGPEAVQSLLAAVASVRGAVWERRGDTAGSAAVVLDIDSTLVEVHSENKTGAAAHFKAGFGFHPMLCATSDGEPLSIMLRPGNAAANNIADHIDVLDAAIEQLPEAVAAGHCASGGAPAPRQVQLRVDAAGCSVHIAEACRQRNIEFFMTARSNDEVTAAIDHNRFDRDTWQPALSADGEPSERAQVRELTNSVDLEGWPERTRFIARREPLHPGAQRTLFDSELWRYRGFYTDADGRPRRARRPHASPRTNREHHRRAQRLRPQTHALQRLRHQRRLDATRRAQHGAGEMVPTTAPARPTGSSRPQTPQMATMARTRPNSALLKKMDPAPARLVARHSATTARLQPRRPIDTRHRAPAPAAARTLTPRAPTPRPAPQNSPNNPHNPNTRPQHNPTSKPATRNHTKKHKPEPLTNSRERSGLGR